MAVVLMLVFQALGRAKNGLGIAAYCAGRGITKAATICALILALILFLGVLLDLMLHDHLLRAAFWWFIGGALLPLALRLFQEPFLFVGELLLALSSRLARKPAPYQGALCVTHPLHPRPQETDRKQITAQNILRLPGRIDTASRRPRHSRTMRTPDRKSA